MTIDLPAMPPCITCRRQLCADYRTCTGALLALLARTEPKDESC